MIKVSEHFLSNMTTIEYPVFKFQRYDLLTIGKTECLVAFPQGKTGEDVKRNAVLVTKMLYETGFRGWSAAYMHSSNALIELLQLAGNIFEEKCAWEPVYTTNYYGNQCEYYFGGMKCNDSSENINILRFAQKYGFISNRACDLDLSESMLPIYTRVAGVPLTDYVRDIYEIYLVYLAWCYLEWGERGTFEKHILNSHFSPTEKHSIDKLSRMILDREGGWLGTSIRYGYCDQIFTKTIFCNGLYAAFHTQLYELAALGDAALEGNTIADCSRCGTPYLKKHGNSTLCEVCKTPKAKSQAFRDKERRLKKEASSNGKEKGK